jgi:kynurenine formamidase
LNIIWDVCGTNDDFKFYKPENLSFVKNLDKCIILFDNDISMISNMLKVINAINPNNMVIVRTKVDQYNNFNSRSIEEEKKIDKRRVKDLLNRDLETYCVSSHNVLNGKTEIYDWKSIRDLLQLDS